MGDNAVRNCFLVAFMSVGLTCALCAQGESKGYMVKDPSGKVVYFIPEVIAEKTVMTAMSLPGAAFTPAARFAVQVGSFAVQANARRLEQRLVRDGYQVSVVSVPLRRRHLKLHVVSVMSLAGREEADRVIALMREAYGLDGIIVGPGGSTLASE